MIGLIHYCENSFEFWICSSSRDCSSKLRYGVKFLLFHSHLFFFFFSTGRLKTGLGDCLNLLLVRDVEVAEHAVQ